MTQVKSHVRWLAPLALIFVAGCAPAYHDYAGCYVGCNYCAPPLPYAHYKDCACHSCTVKKYLTLPPQAALEDAGKHAN